MNALHKAAEERSLVNEKVIVLSTVNPVFDVLTVIVIMIVF